MGFQNTCNANNANMNLPSQSSPATQACFVDLFFRLFGNLLSFVEDGELEATGHVDKDHFLWEHWTGEKYSFSIDAIRILKTRIGHSLGNSCNWSLVILVGVFQSEGALPTWHELNTFHPQWWKTCVSLTVEPQSPPLDGRSSGISSSIFSWSNCWC